MDHTQTVPAARSSPQDAAPADRVRSQIDSALAAQIAASNGAVGAPGVARTSVLPPWMGSSPASLIAPGLLALATLLLGMRVLCRRRTVPAEPQPAVGEPDVTDAAERPWRPTPKPAPSMVLPPHVVAMLERADAKRLAGGGGPGDGVPSPSASSLRGCAEPPGGDGPDAGEEGVRPERSLRPGPAGVDLWIGR